MSRFCRGPIWSSSPPASAASVIASLAKELDALTVAVVTRPFGFDGRKRMKVAEEGLARLASTVLVHGFNVGGCAARGAVGAA